MAGTLLADEKRLYEDSPGLILPGDKRFRVPDGLDERGDFVFDQKRKLYVPNVRRRGKMPGNEEDRPSRWDKYQAVKTKYPIINLEKYGPLEVVLNTIKIPLYNWVSKGLDQITPAVSSTDNFITDVFRAFTTAYSNRFSQTSRTLVWDTFPRIRTWLSYAEGATNIENLYVIEHKGCDIPVFLQNRGQSDPEEAALKENIEFVQNNDRSIYDKMGDSDPVLNRTIANPGITGDFVSYAAEKYSRTDYEYFQQEPAKMNRAWVKDETWVIQQYGQRDAAKEGHINSTMTLPANVKVYRTPTQTSGFWHTVGKFLGDPDPKSWRMWWYWQAGDWIYDAIDSIFDPIQDLLEKTGVPHEGMRHFIEEEYKAIARTRRGFFNPSSPNLTYNVS